MKIYCKNTKEYLTMLGGEKVSDLLPRLKEVLPFKPICAYVNNKTEDLSFPLFSPKQVEFLPANSETGKRVYVRSLCMMLYKAVAGLLPKATLKIDHSIAGGHYCRLLVEDEEMVPDQAFMDLLTERMQSLVDSDIPFKRHERLTKDVIAMYREQGLDAKVNLLETLHELYTTYYNLAGIADGFYGPLAPSTGFLKDFDLRPYKQGFLLFPHSKEETEKSLEKNPPGEKMFKAFTDQLRFNYMIRVTNVGDLNRAVQEKRTPGLINVAEAMHEKLIGEIASEIAERRKEGNAGIVLVAGPSSSGKTTSTKRLAIHLATNLIVPKMISLDDYFVNREDTPRDETGDYDFESLYALDLQRLNSDLEKLLRGEEVNIPTYSFELGKRIEKPKPLRLDKNDVLLMEGIHGLNPELTHSIEENKVFKVYVSALTTLKIDNHNWISTSDNRLLRRIVRDYKYRGTSALESIRRWPSVRRGEEKWIFPYSENADATFNSSLIFEIGAMKEFAIPLLREVPRDNVNYSQAYRLMKLLSYFEPIPLNQIPSTSLLREFLGGSSFNY
ncbi:MAG: nucleoside kinase [Muribaculaceae bacterium]|nr:nucleoside kinase [Muribaculaceae bacterium]